MNKFIKIEFECLCNLNCDYCHAYMNKHKTDIKKVIREMEKIFSKYEPSTTFFRVEGIGEITLYPEIIEYLEKKAGTEGYFIEVLTNGILAGKFIKETPSLIWVVSLDGNTAEMNSHRNLNQAQIDKILGTIIEFSLEIQCVYYKQTMEEMNGFINYLNSVNYLGFLHISPRKYHNKPLQHYLDNSKLLSVNFIPDSRYFSRWKYIIENQKRKFTCEFFDKGYVYRIMRSDEETKKIKCDCGSFDFENDSDQEHCYNQDNCGTCICQFEYDVGRKMRAIAGNQIGSFLKG